MVVTVALVLIGANCIKNALFNSLERIPSKDPDYNIPNVNRDKFIIYEQPYNAQSNAFYVNKIDDSNTFKYLLYDLNGNLLASSKYNGNFIISQNNDCIYMEGANNGSFTLYKGITPIGKISHSSPSLFKLQDTCTIKIGNKVVSTLKGGRDISTGVVSIELVSDYKNYEGNLSREELLLVYTSYLISNFSFFDPPLPVYQNFMKN